MTKEQLIETINKIRFSDSPDFALSISCANALEELGLITYIGEDVEPNLFLLMEYPEAVHWFVSGMCLFNTEKPRN